MQTVSRAKEGKRTSGGQFEPRQNLPRHPKDGGDGKWIIAYMLLAVYTVGFFLLHLHW